MFNQKKKKKEQNLKRLKILGIFVLILNALGCIFFFLKPKRWKRFLKGEKKEIEELSTGKETFGRFCHDSWKLTKDVFVPHEGNNHKPKALRPKSLVSYILIIILVKLVVTGFLFITYPDPAQLAAIVASRMVNLVNAARIESGEQPLAVNEILSEAATAKGQDMLDRQYFSHDTPDGKRPWQWIDRSKYDYVYAGENLAMDFTSAEIVQAAFMKSPTHRRNILNPKYKEIGIAVLNGEINGRPTILLVEFFGTQRKDVSTLASAQPVETVTPQPSPVAQPLVTKEEKKVEVAGEQISPPTSIEPPVEGVIIVTTEQKSSKALIDLVIEYSNIFFIAFLIFILISLLLNIFVKIKVQHSSVILQTIVVIALLLAMILVKFHFTEQISPHLLIL